MTDPSSIPTNIRENCVDITSRASPICQRECDLMVDSIATLGLEYDQATTCSDMERCSADANQWCIPSNRECNAYCKSKHLCTLSNAADSKSCVNDTKVRMKCSDGTVDVQIDAQLSSTTQDIASFLDDPLVRCDAVNFLDTSSDQTLIPQSNQTVYLHTEYFNDDEGTSSIEFTAELSCSDTVDSIGSDVSVTPKSMQFVSRDGSATLFMIPTIDLSECDANPFLRVSLVRIACNESCVTCVQRCVDNGTVWSSDTSDIRNSATILNIVDTSTTQSFYVIGQPTGHITVSGFGFHLPSNSTTFDNYYPASISFSGGVCEDIALKLLPCGDDNVDGICDNVTRLCTVCGSYDLESANCNVSSHYGSNVIRLHLDVDIPGVFTTSTSIVKPIAMTQVASNSVASQTVICDNDMTVTITGESFLNTNASNYAASFEIVDQIDDTVTSNETIFAAFEYVSNSAVVFNLNCAQTFASLSVDCKDRRLRVGEFVADDVTQSLSTNGVNVEVADVLCIVDTSTSVAIYRKNGATAHVVTVRGHGFRNSELLRTPTNMISFVLQDIDGESPQQDVALTSHAQGGNDVFDEVELTLISNQNLWDFTGLIVYVSFLRQINIAEPAEDEPLIVGIGSLTQIIDTDTTMGFHASSSSDLVLSGHGFDSSASVFVDYEFETVNQCDGCVCECTNISRSHILFEFQSTTRLYVTNQDLSGCTGCSVVVSNVTLEFENGEAADLCCDSGTVEHIGQVLTITEVSDNDGSGQLNPGASSDVTIKGAGFGSSATFDVIWTCSSSPDGLVRTSDCEGVSIATNSTVVTRTDSNTLVASNLNTERCTGYLFAELTYTTSDFETNIDVTLNVTRVGFFVRVIILLFSICAPL